MTTRVGATGSRFFGKAKAGADYDFYAQDGPAVRANLLSEGFRELKYRGTCGPNVVTIFRHGEGPGHVDIALVRSFARKHLENRIMTLTPFRLVTLAAPKPLRSAVWRVVQRLT